MEPLPLSGAAVVPSRHVGMSPYLGRADTTARPFDLLKFQSMPETTSTLHLGITMAGAVSGGAYTAGVMDYLFEALQQWEAAKNEEKDLPPEQKKVPYHQVQIDVIGGASAGAITAAFAALACYTGIESVRDHKTAKFKHFKPKNNLLFDAWVNLAGGKKVPEPIRRMLSTKDLSGSDGIPSLLNSAPIDEVSSRAIEHVACSPKKPWPSFVAEDLEILLTLCSLRGIPVGIDFNSDNNSWSARPSHQMSIHKQYARFTTHGETMEAPRAMLIRKSDRDTLENLINCAKASAAFPMGLQARDVSLSRNHVKHQFGIFYQLNEAALDSIFESGNVPDPFEFTSIDGGALNNEPFTEIALIMRERKIDDFAMILVDPFPNFSEKPQKYKPQKFLRELGISILGALRNQGMLKETDLKEMGGRKKEVRATYKKNMIYPTRRVFNPKSGEWDKQKNPMACGALGGFSGLLSRDFRVHDYFLGRQNCRNFLHSYFTMEFKTSPSAENHEIFKDWTPQMRQRYQVVWRDEPGIIHLPIIPVLDFVKEEERIESELADHTPEEREAAMLNFARKSPCEFPSIHAKQVNALWIPIAWRVFRMSHRTTDNLYWAIRWPFRILLFVIAPLLFWYLARKVVQKINADLAENNLIKKRKAT